MEPISTNASKAQVMERLGWERRHWVRFLEFTSKEAKKIASFDKTLWKGATKCEMKTYLEVPDAVMVLARKNVNDWLKEHQGLEEIDEDVFNWRMKQALYYELKKCNDTPAPDSQYYDPVRDSAGPSPT